MEKIKIMNLNMHFMSHSFCDIDLWLFVDAVRLFFFYWNFLLNCQLTFMAEKSRDFLWLCTIQFLKKNTVHYKLVAY